MSDPREVHVAVILKPGSTPPFEFTTADLPMIPQNHLIFKNCHHDGFLVHYDLQDEGEYVFPDSSMFPNPPDQHLREALYCAPNTTCPSSPSTWGQFKAKEVINNGKTLVVHNRNRSYANFAYTLRVTADNGATFLDLDPGGTNQNGSTQPIFSFSYVALAGVAVAAASAFGTAVALFSFR